VLVRRVRPCSIPAGLICGIRGGGFVRAKPDRVRRRAAAAQPGVLLEGAGLDDQGGASPWSETARWTTALRQPDDWQAVWIGAGSFQPGQPLPLFRRAFEVAKPVRRALVHVCGLGQFDLFLDGKKVGDHFLDPAWSVYEKTVYYTTFDVTASSRRGRTPSASCWQGLLQHCWRSPGARREREPPTPVHPASPSVLRGWHGGEDPE